MPSHLEEKVDFFFLGNDSTSVVISNNDDAYNVATGETLLLPELVDINHYSLYVTDEFSAHELFCSLT